MHNNNQKDQTKRPRDQRSPSEEKLSPDYKTARHHEDKMAEPTLEEDDISLKDIKQTLDAIQKTLGEVLSQNVQFKNEVMELKASSRANNRQLEDLKAKVTKLTEENLLLRNELDQSRLRVQTLYEEKMIYGTAWIALKCIRERTQSKFTAYQEKRVHQQKK